MSLSQPPQCVKHKSHSERKRRIPLALYDPGHKVIPSVAKKRSTPPTRPFFGHIVGRVSGDGSRAVRVDKNVATPNFNAVVKPQAETRMYTFERVPP